MFVSDRIMLREEFEIMAPVGSRDSLTAAIQAGADSIYFGIERLNMRAGSASAFTIDDLREIAETCRRHGIKSYLTVNTIIYDEDIELMHQIVDAAREAGISAIIASDIAVMQYCRNRVECRDENAEFATALPSADGKAVANSTLYTLHSETASTPYTLNNKPIEVHLSTQLNISNVEALRFYAQFADVVVLARELNVGQVERIHRAIVEEHICGPSGRPVRIEMFCHGALCMAVSGKCYMSLHAANRSANRGECIQVCRRSYTATDNETGYQLEIDNKYIMSPKDLKTIRFIDRLMRVGVRVFKIEGRARGPEYVYTVVKCYREAIDAVIHDAVNPDAEPLFTKARKDEWDERLARVFNRGFWDGYYQGQLMGEWNKEYGSCATERKVYVGRGVKYFSRIGVAEFTVEATTFSVGDRLLVTGPTTGAMYLTATEIHDNDGRPVQTAPQGQRVAIPVTAKIRPSDKLFRLDSLKTKKEANN
jgi:putative protease